MATGKIKWFSKEKGYGFIIPDQAGADMFVHAKALEKAQIYDLKEGQAVSYDVGDNKGRSCAVNIALI